MHRKNQPKTKVFLPVCKSFRYKFGQSIFVLIRKTYCQHLGYLMIIIIWKKTLPPTHQTWPNITEIVTKIIIRLLCWWWWWLWCLIVWYLVCLHFLSLSFTDYHHYVISELNDQLLSDSGSYLSLSLSLSLSLYLFC